MPTHHRDMRKAVAMAYRDGDVAPKVIAKGCGATADAIVSLASEHGVYIHESRELLNLLMQVELDKYIPPELYLAVAELLAWLYRLEGQGGQTGHGNIGISPDGL